MPRGQGADTPMRNGIRVPDEVWIPFNEAVRRKGSNRTKEQVEFMAWFARIPGAKMPKRPAPDTKE